MAEPDVLPRVLSGRYRLEATLGQGGMGVVYRGTDLATNRPVAVKLVRAADGGALDEDVAGRFLREARNTARIQQEHIIEVYDSGRTEGSLYFVMELLEGESLASCLKREGKLDPPKAVHIARQICAALEVAHGAGLVHRDLKPANIMLLKRGADDAFVKVLDFGVAKTFGPNGLDETQLTHTGMLVGTIDYMAPEQIMGRAMDGRSDIYSLGVVLYRMLAGKLPFAETNVPQLINAHMNTMPKPLTEVTDGVPNELDHVILRCLAKKPERRYESMGELARALIHSVAADSLEMLASSSSAHDDVYDDDSDLTAVARAPEPPVPAPLPTLDDVTLSAEVPLEDATVLMDHRPFAVPAPPPPAPMPPPPAPMPPAGPATVKIDASMFRGPGSGHRGAPPPQQQPWGPAPFAPPPPPQPPSLWQRFLAWTGLR